MKKNNIRSIRFSDKIADLIDRQQGRNFSEKFENLVTRCAFEIPAAEKQLEEIKAQQQKEAEKLENLTRKYLSLTRTIGYNLEEIAKYANSIARM